MLPNSRTEPVAGSPKCIRRGTSTSPTGYICRCAYRLAFLLGDRALEEQVAWAIGGKLAAVGRIGQRDLLWPHPQSHNRPGRASGIERRCPGHGGRMAGLPCLDGKWELRAGAGGMAAEGLGLSAGREAYRGVGPGACDTTQAQTMAENSNQESPGYVNAELLAASHSAA